MNRKWIVAAGLVLALGVAGAVVAQEASTLEKEFEAAQVAMADRDFPAASRLLTDFVVKYPAGERTEEAHVLLVRAKAGTGDFEGAIAAAQNFLGGFPDSPWRPKVLFVMGEAYARARGFKDAARIYREQVDFLSGEVHEQRVAGYYLGLADRAYDGEEQPDEFGRPKVVKDFARALDYYQKARAIREKAADPARLSHRIADSRFQTGDFAGAIAEWEDLLKKHAASEHADDATYFCGVARLKVGDVLTARKMLKEVREKFGDSPFAALSLVRLGESYSPLGTADEDARNRGVEYWREFRRTYPAHEDGEQVAYDIGEAFFKAGRFDAAVEEFRAYLAAFPDAKHSPAAQDRIARAFYQRADFDQAMAEWKSFLGKWPNHELWTQVQGAIAQAVFAKGAHPFNQGTQGKEPDAALLAKAEEAFKAFLVTYPVHERSGEAQYFLGEIRYRLKDFAGAISEWKVAATKYAETKWASAALFRIAAAEEKDLGNLPRAIEGYEELVGRYSASSEAAAAKALLDQFRGKTLELVTERVLRTDEKCRVKLRTRNIEALSFRAYRVNAEEIFRRRLTLSGIEAIVVDVVKPDLSETVRTPNYEKFRLFEREQELALAGPGSWIVTCHDEDLTAIALVVVSDLSFVVKQSPAQTLVFAVNERTGEPVPGARVVLAASGKIRNEGATGAEGVYVHEAGYGGETVVFAEKEGHVAVTGLAPGAGSTFGYSTKAYLYTDRPLYRPGQDVGIKGIVRRVENGAYVTSENQEVLLSVLDPRDTVVLESKAKTGEYGTFSASLLLPPSAALGDYRIVADLRGHGTFTGGFAVREYKKPEFTITARTDRRAYLPGEEVKVSVALRYFFGGPVPKAKVRWRLARSPWAFSPEEHDEFAWFTKDPERERERERREAAGTMPVSEGEIVTDADGNAEVTFKAEDLDQDARYLILFEALDLNRQWVRDAAMAVVSRQAFYAIAKAERKVYRPNEEASIRFTTVDALHFPLAVTGEVVVARRAFDGGQETEAVVSRQPLATGEDGRAEAKVKIERPGEYRVKFEGKDRAGNLVTGGVVVTIAGEAEDLAKDAKVVAARQIYREGEIADVLVNAPSVPAWALVTFEGERVLDHKVVRLTERSTTLRLLMKPEYAPNVFIKVAIPKDHELKEAYDEVFVFKYLEVSVAPDRAEAKPGEEVAFRLVTTDQRGNPVAAEVSLALVDRSILSLEPDRAAQIKPFFYDQRRSLAVTTGASSSFRYQGQTRPTNKDLLAEELRRLGPEAFNRAMKYVRAAREYLERSDLESAVIELRKALQVTPGNFLAAQMLAEAEARLAAAREDARLKSWSRAEDKKSEGDRNDDEDAYRDEEKAEEVAKSKDGAGSGGGGGGVAGRRARGGGYRGPAGGVPPASRAPGDPAPSPAPEPMADGAPAEGKPQSDVQDQLGALRLERAAGDVAVHGERLNQALAGLDDVTNGLVAMQTGQLAETTLRRRFADTAAWMPHVVTGADGKAEVKVTLPDNLTTWRATVRGATKATLVGEATADIVARKNLLVRIDTPRFLTQRDRVVATATVHNDLGDPVEVHLGTTTTGHLSLGEGASTKASLKPHEIRAFDVPFAAAEPGLARLTAEAKTTVESDAAETGLPVLPLGLRTLVGRSGEVTEEALEVFTLPPETIPGTRDLAISLSAGIDSSLLESLIYLGRFPYGCLEQTVNRFLPAVAAEKALRAVGSPNEKLKSELRKAVEQGLLALYTFQNDDGSFGWFSGGVRRMAPDREPPPPRTDATMTALAILAIETARQEGYRISGPNRDRALAAGQRLVKATEDNGEKSFLLYALSRGGAADLEDLNQVYRYRDGLSPYALAYLSLAMAETKRAPNALALVRLLAAKAVQKDGYVWFEGENRHGASNTVETTAAAIMALLASEPESLLLDGAARWLLVHKKGPAWESTRDTGAAVTALAGYLLAKGVARAEYEVEVWLNDGATPYQKIQVAGGQVAGDQKRVVLVDAARLRAGENRVRIVKRGPGTLYYTLMLNYWTEAAEIAPAGNLVKLARAYVEYVSPVAVREGAEEIRPGYTIVEPEARPKEADAPTIERAGSGDKFRIRLTLSARERLRYVLLEDPLPAGVEVVEGQATGPFDYEERRDEKQVFFLSDVPEGTVELTYVVQAIHPGAYAALPAFAYPMYEPEIYGRSGLNRLAVAAEAGVVGRGGAAEGVTPDELFALAKRDLKAEKWEAARDGLKRLLAEYRLLDQYEEQCLSMLMRIAFRLADHKGAVEAYEKLVEVNPRRGPETTAERKSLAVAYQGIGEDERALTLFRGLTDEYLAREIAVAETYRGLGNPYLAQDFTLRTLRSYPDSNAVVDAAWRVALNYLELKRKPEEKAPVKPAGAVETGLMLEEALGQFRAFLAHYPSSPLADEAARMTVAVLNRMERFAEAVQESERFIRRYRESAHLDDVYYYLAESFFGQGQYEKVFETGKAILTEKFRPEPGSRERVPSGFIPHVKYLFAKVHHLKGDLAKAVELYSDRDVASQFEDARDALAFLTEEALKFPETAVFGTEERAVLKVGRKNLTALELRVYPVDLMLLVAVKKDLRAASDIDLTGIATQHRTERSWADGKDYRWHEEEVPLELAGKGVYLVVAKAGERLSSGLVIVSDLEISVQTIGDRVRVYATDRKTREPKADVFVKVTDGKTIRAQGFTDARGVFEGPGAASVMVVAEKEGHFALFRR